MNTFALIGGGGFANEIKDTIEQNGDYIKGYFDIKKSSINLKYLGDDKNINRMKKSIDYFFLAVGATDNKSLQLRKNLINKLKKNKIIFKSIISKHAQVSKSAKISRGTYVGSGVIVGPNVKIGSNSIISMNSVISHDTQIGSNVSIFPLSAISGNVNIKNDVIIGTGSKIIHGINISSNVVTSIGSNIFNDIKKNKTVFLRN